MSRYAAVAALAILSTALTVHSQAPAAAPAPQPPSTPPADVQRGYAGLKANILKSADKMPAENYSYRPTPEVRTFARVVNHVTEAQFHSCGAINGTAATANTVPPETADKATIVAALQASFAECDKAFAGLTEANMLEKFKIGPATRARISLSWGTVSHDNEQYATLALYMRLKGLAPPSSEK
ncbi:MAG TPA: DinB family protein [Acidobacteriaceae bacterium]|nr:DinB family protein [Acidobacteriaceae bacterium]